VRQRSLIRAWHYIFPVRGSLEWPPLQGTGLDLMDMMKSLTSLRKAAAVMAVLACPLLAEAEGSDEDPLEGFNRAVFAFNDVADSYLISPVARGYRAVTPDPVEQSVYRIFVNASEVNSAFNSLLQAKLGKAARHSGRFLINTTLGIGGLIDVADPMGIPRDEPEDFGQTLGVWGVGSGPYLVLPLLGPSTLRDTPTRYVDSFLEPVNYIEHVPTRNTVHGVDLLSTRAELLKADKLISGDKYVFTREVYLQRRAYLISDGVFEDDFGDDDYGDFDGQDFDSEYAD
jgi:phospholipid-binding lipoprotein MlaA